MTKVIRRELRRGLMQDWPDVQLLDGCAVIAYQKIIYCRKLEVRWQSVGSGRPGAMYWDVLLRQ